MSRLRFLLYYSLCLAAAILAVDYGIYRARFGRLLDGGPQMSLSLQPIPGISPQTMRRLGWGRYPKKDSSFDNFPKRKPARTVRIGCFGDSFTYGDEVGPAEDYPSLLQNLFRDAGYKNVEVLNFGAGWYGAHQSFTLWNEAGKDFDLDYVLWGPESFFPERDCTFNHTYPRYNAAFHARYVLKGDGVELAEVPGTTPAEQMSSYFGFWPGTYRKYDRRPPPALAALVPGDRVLPNPFYYTSRAQWPEAMDIFKRLLAKMADSGTQIVVGHYNPAVAAGAASLGRPNICAVPLKHPNRYPYVTPRGHNSAAGNQILAEQYFAILTGRSSHHAGTVKIVGDGRLFPLKYARLPRPLEDYERFEICLGPGTRWCHAIEPNPFAAKSGFASGRETMFARDDATSSTLDRSLDFPLPGNFLSRTEGLGRGTLDFVFHGAGGAPVRIPIAQWRRHMLVTPLANPRRLVPRPSQ